jgi:16S rRNA (guanine527-N7)-methyltransferase
MFHKLLEQRLVGIAEVTRAQADALSAHYELLLKWNKVLNLTTVEGLETAVERHYCECVFAAAHLPAGEWSIVDAGSGAGFPGIPIAVMRPECLVTLVESHQRKAVFLREASRGMANVKVAATRLELVTGTFDWLVSRAVSYRDLMPGFRGLARQFELLSGAEGPPAVPGVRWEEPIALPWGKQRFLRIGECFT